MACKSLKNFTNPNPVITQSDFKILKMLFQIFEFLKNETTKTLWMISDFLTGDTPMRRIIRTVNQQTNRLQKRIDRIDLHIAKLMDAVNSSARSMEMVYESYPQHDISTLRYHFSQVEAHNKTIKQLTNFKSKCGIIKAQVLDQILHAQLADDMNEARQVLKEVNDYNDQMNVVFNMEQFNMETIRGNETRHALDDAVANAKGDTVIEIDKSEQKLGSVDPNEEERFADMVTNIANRVQQKRNQNHGAIEVVVSSRSSNNIPTEQQLEARFNQLRSSDNTQ